jgi:hypothetical protein
MIKSKQIKGGRIPQLIIIYIFAIYKLNVSV